MAAQSTTTTTNLSALHQRRLLIICPTETWGGVEKNVRLRAAAMAMRGYTVTIVLCKDTFEDRFNDLPGVQIETLQRRPSSASPRSYWTYYKLIKKHQPTCVFVPLKQDWWVATVAAHLARVPKRVLYLGIKRRVKENLKYRLLFTHLKAQLIVNSKDLRDHLFNTNRYLNRQNLTVIYNGFTIPELVEHTSRSTLRTSLNIPVSAPVIGCAGRLSHQKGFDLLPDVLARLPADVHIVVAGEGALEQTLGAAFNNTDYAQRLHLIGRQNDMALFYQSIDYFLLPSRNEGMANVLNEALSYGLPLVSTRVPGSTELLEVEQNTPPSSDNGRSFWLGNHGLLTNINDVQGLADAINALLTGEVHFAPDHQRNKIRRDHDLTIMMDLTENCFFTTNADSKRSTTNQANS